VQATYAQALEALGWKDGANFSIKGKNIMTRAEKEQFKNNIKLFYITSIKNAGGFDYWLDEWLFYQVSKTFNISLRTAKRYFFQLLPKDFIKEYEY
jgi:hypothetical protein